MSSKEKIIFIVNPKSGTNNKKEALALIGEEIDQEKFEIEIRYTEHVGHAVELATQAAADKVEYVVAIGGDGTVNEIARALVHTDTTLGIIPSGSGNGLARHLHIPMEVKKAIEVINRKNVTVIDYGKINGTPFFCTCGVGFDAFVSLKFAQAGKRGLLTYLEQTLTESLKYKPETYEIETEDEKVKYKAFLIACANASQYGNNAYIAPHAMLNDGLMDVTILEPFTILDVPSLAFQLFNKTLDQNSRIKTFQCKKMRIHRSGEGVVHFDGDPLMIGADIDIEILPKGLKVVVPNNEGKNEVNILQRAYDYFSGFNPIEAIAEDISQTNKKIMSQNKKLLNKLTKKK